MIRWEKSNAPQDSFLREMKTVKEKIRTLMDGLDDIEFQLEEMLMGTDPLDESHQHLADATDFIQSALNSLDEIFV